MKQGELRLSCTNPSIFSVHFYPRPFWPTGIVIACVCVCVCVSVCVSTFACPDDNSSHVPARITWFGRKAAKHFALGPYCFGGWLSLTFHVKFNFFLKSCLFASLLRDVQKRSLLNCSTSHLVLHTFWFLYMHTDRVVPRTVKQSITYLCETIAVLPALDSAIGSGFYKLLSVFRQIILVSHAYILYYNIGNHQNNCKTAFICLYLFVSHTLRSPLFLARLSTHASPRLFHIPTSFVRRSPITMLTNRLCHGPWRGLGDSAL